MLCFPFLFLSEVMELEMAIEEQRERERGTVRMNTGWGSPTV